MTDTSTDQFAATRVSSGDPALDGVLGGGIRVNSIALIAGEPGSGKTLLAQQYAFTNATVDRPALYLTTVSEPFDKLVSYGQDLAFFAVADVGRRVHYHDAGTVLHERGLPGLLDLLDSLLVTQHPGLLVVDSFKALQPFARSEGEYRRFLHDVAGRLSAFAVTSLWVGEYLPESVGAEPEFAVVDAILQLTITRQAERTMRLLEVRKLRGSSFSPGQHSYRLSSSGLQVFPRLADRDQLPTADTPLPDGHKVSSGVHDLDAMLDGGYWPGSTTLVAGPAGSGKTVLGLRFCLAGTERGEPALIASFQEPAPALRRTAAGLGWAWPERLHVLHRVPVDLYADEWAHELLGLVSRTSARRLVVDSLGDLRLAVLDEPRFRELLFSLARRMTVEGVTTVFTLEVPQLFGITHLSDIAVSHLTDNVVLLQYLRGESQLKRSLTVLKSRASRHHPDIRQFDIGPDGLHVDHPFGTDQNLR